MLAKNRQCIIKLPWQPIISPFTNKMLLWVLTPRSLWALTPNRLWVLTPIKKIFFLQTNNTEYVIFLHNKKNDY